MPPNNLNNRSIQKPTDVVSKLAASVHIQPNSLTTSHLSSDKVLTTSFTSLTVKDAIVSSEPMEQTNQDVLSYVPKLDDEKTHLSISSTKALSLDGKSVASGTTFALDEKESIRPDDSASVQAVEDDDNNSGPGSSAQNSRFGSETGGKPFHAQLREISIQRGIPAKIPLGTEDRHSGLISGSVQMSALPPNLGHQSLPIPSQFSYWMPDEKLLEALDSPKDRLFLLQLEQKIVSFVQNPTENSLDLPPYNSFLRLLAHRLGDYYRLSHFVDSSANAVRLYKTGTTQLPTPLSAFRPGGSSDDVPPTQPSMKIMRRSGTVGLDGQIIESGNTTNNNSIVPSKAGSETDEDNQKVSGMVSPAESLTAKDKATQTREEREAKYKEVRERIFADWKEGENEKDQSNGASTDASRASSVSGKKKKKKNDDDGFEARSAFYRQHPQGFDQSAGSMGYFNPFMIQGGAPNFQTGVGQSFPQSYSTIPQAQMFSNTITSPTPQNGMYQPNNPQQYMNYGMQPQQMPAQYYQPMPGQTQMAYTGQFAASPGYNTFNPQLSRPASQMSDQSWNQGVNTYPMYNGTQNSYNQQSQGISPSPSNAMSLPYAYGQLPYQAHSPSNRNAHPVPGSYSRQNFNAQARVFVPGDSSLHDATNNHDRQGPQLPQINPLQPPYSFPQQVSIPHTQLMPSYGNPTSSSPRKTPNPSSQSQTSTLSTISKWGTPSTLPPKPPPPANQHVTNTAMPTYQNGIYTKPASMAQDTRAH
jgi:hypothetical protein